MGWTDERVALLKKLWMEGHSAAQIAKQLGGGVTRNAVIGKVHRLGLAGRATPSRPAKRPARPQQARPRSVGAPSAPSAPRPRISPSMPMLHLVPPLEPLRRDDGSVTTVLTLNDRVCKWPIGDPGSEEFAFCGRGSCAGPYCAEHARMAFQPQQQKKKRAMGEPDELRRALRMVANG
jgi:GcrA cell cycle regulator